MQNITAIGIVAGFITLRLIGILDTSVGSELSTIIDLVANGGSIVIVALVLWWFVTGRLQSAKVIQDQRTAMSAAIQEMITSKISTAVVEGVKQGMMEAWYEQKKINEQERARRAGIRRKTQPRNREEKKDE